MEGSGKRFGCNLISTLTNRGTLRFQVFEGRFTTEVFLEFLGGLVRSTNRKVFLMVDRHPVHRAHRVQEWVLKSSTNGTILLTALQPRVQPGRIP